MQNLFATVVAVAGVAQANYLSGEVRSQEWFHYGKFIAKMQNPMKMGTVQSFFTYTAQDWPHGWNEIDVEVVPSVTENPFSMNIIWKDGAQEHNYATGFHPGTDWFTYTVEWTPDYVSWYVNDKLVRKSEGQEDVHFLNMPTQLMMNFWTPCWEPWNDYFDDAEMPWFAKYDYVEVHDYDIEKKEFNLRWKDDFNTFDSKKWYASDNWGFENNSSLFMSSQVYVEDGSLVLKMDYNDGHARTFPEHHQIVHHDQPVHEVVHHVVEQPVAVHHFESFAQKETPAHHEAAKPVHHEAAKPVHHEAAKPVHHEVAAKAHVEAAVHHEAPVGHHEAPVAHHQAADVHKYEAPLVHHSAYYEDTGYPHHYSEADFETVSHAYSDTHIGYPEHVAYPSQHHVYAAPVAEHHVYTAPPPVVQPHDAPFAYDQYPQYQTYRDVEHQTEHVYPRHESTYWNQ